MAYPHLTTECYEHVDEARIRHAARVLHLEENCNCEDMLACQDSVRLVIRALSDDLTEVRDG